MDTSTAATYQEPSRLYKFAICCLLGTAWAEAYFWVKGYYFQNYPIEFGGYLMGVGQWSYVNHWASLAAASVVGFAFYKRSVATASSLSAAIYTLMIWGGVGYTLYTGYLPSILLLSLFPIFMGGMIFFIYSLVVYVGNTAFFAALGRSQHPFSAVIVITFFLAIPIYATSIFSTVAFALIINVDGLNELSMYEKEGYLEIKRTSGGANIWDIVSDDQLTSQYKLMEPFWK